MDTQLAGLSRTIDPAVLGSRLRVARVAAGLSQGEVAGEDVSTAYVSRIEAGQRRPEFKLLERFASRLGTTLESLLLGIDRDLGAELRLALDYADLALRSGNAAEAHLGASNVVDKLAGTSVDDLLSEARLIVALALEALGNLDDAISSLESLVASGGEANRWWLSAAMGLTRCYRECGDLNRSIETGEKAIGRLTELGLGGTDEAIQLVVTTSAAYFERGDVQHAIRMCRQASNDAEGLNSPKARASAYWNASIFESKQGSVQAAVALARQAIVLMEQANEHTAIAMLNNQLGTILLRLEPPDAESAIEVLTLASNQLTWSAASVVDLAHNQVALARAHFLMGDTHTAERLVSEANGAAGPTAPMIRVTALVLTGQIQAAEGRIDDARQSYLDAVQTLTGIGADRQAAQLWFELGALLEEVGESEQARDAYKRAAVSTGLSMPTTSRRVASGS